MNAVHQHFLEIFGRWAYLLGASLIAGKAIAGVTAGVLALSRWLSTPEFIWFLFALVMGLQAIFGVNRKLIAARPELTNFVYWSYFGSGLFFLLLAVFFAFFLKPSYTFLP
ncbi:hypothetical protein [Meiothermus hypogaeus]|uniref:Uncharacterized protein n=2 Tax=Meiothermus hypogaeus TaxID=884155 RepID=A0A511R2F1_9DEIN|nr:hypothetical protein [Meiothermus hypogaeus]RIH80497.1 hypothetical protein Mhypo_00413 [Meiothermus hypogaeus]GEM83785.1 hypothetical protein MHY01S_19510 [Meiothermus hypogaeus NBRC 106114]